MEIRIVSYLLIIQKMFMSDQALMFILKYHQNKVAFLYNLYHRLYSENTIVKNAIIKNAIVILKIVKNAIVKL